MFKKYCLSLFCTFLYTIHAYASTEYAIAKLPTPVLDTADFKSVFGGRKSGSQLHQDESGLIREVEFIALPGTVFKIDEIIKKDNSIIYKVQTAEYPYKTQSGYFIDHRFVTRLSAQPEERVKTMPSKKEIIKRLVATEGATYIWGGNWAQGMPELLNFYPPQDKIDSDLKTQWQLKGVDCSGLLYEATNGITPRNTSGMVNYGQAVEIEGLTLDAMIQNIEPLDVIVWRGHVMVALDQERVIQSRLAYPDMPGEKGVKIQSLRSVLAKLLKEKKAVNDYASFPDQKRFVIRRWVNS